MLSLSLIWIMSYYFCFCGIRFGTLSIPSSFIGKCHGLHFREELSPPEELIFDQSRERWCLLLKQVLVSAGNDCTGNIAEGKDVTDWTAVGSSVSDVKDFVEYVFNGPWHEGLLQRITNSKRVLHDVELHRDVRALYKHLELLNCPDMFFFRPMWNCSLRNASCKNTADAVLWRALNCAVCPVSPPAAEPVVKMKPQNTEIKLLFIWLVS